MITRNSVEGAYPVTTLDKVVNFLDSKRRPVTESERIPGPYPYYGANGIQGNIDSYIFDEPLVLLAEDGGHFDDPRRGIAYRISGKTWVNNHAHVLQPKPGLDLAFLCRVLENYDVKPFVTGTTRGKLTKAGASGIPIPIPPVPEQRRIASILDQADALRAKRREALAQLDSLTQSIFIEMFGDPVVNPMSWNCRSLDEVTNKVTDGEHLNPTFAESGMPIVMAGNVLVDQIDLDVAKKVDTALGQQFRKKCGPEFGDLLIVGRGATIGRLCRVNVPDSFCLMGSVILVKPDRSMLNERYLSGMLAMPSMHAMLYKTSGSSAQQAIYLKDVKKLACPMPPLPLQQTFATRIQAVEALKAVHRTSLAELDTLFASLQHRAFRGEL